MKHSACLWGSLFAASAVLRRAEPVRRQVRRCFGAPKRNSPSGSAAGCFGAELWFGAPNRRQTHRFGAENLPQITSGRMLRQETSAARRGPRRTLRADLAFLLLPMDASLWHCKLVQAGKLRADAYHFPPGSMTRPLGNTLGCWGNVLPDTWQKVSLRRPQGNVLPPLP